jgi:hypothetical protein
VTKYDALFRFRVVLQAIHVELKSMIVSPKSTQEYRSSLKEFYNDVIRQQRITPFWEKLTF